MPSPEQQDIWAHHIWPCSGAGEGGRLCPSLPEEVASFTLHAVRDRLSAIQSKHQADVKSLPQMLDPGGQTTACAPLTVLEVYVHTTKVREQLRVLAHVCRCAVSAEDIHQMKSTGEGEEHGKVGARSSSPRLEQEKVRRADVGSERESDSMPLSIADSRTLLRDLYRRVERCDSAGADVWRTLLRRSLQPYLDGLRNAIFLAQVEDHHEEFLLKHDRAVAERCAEHYSRAFTLRPASACPFFLASVRTQILRTVQGLSVLRACKPDDALTAIQEPPALELRYAAAAVQDLEAEHLEFHRLISEKAERAALARRRQVLLDEHERRVAFRERIQGLVHQYRALQDSEVQAMRARKEAQQQERDALQQQASGDQARRRALGRLLPALCFP